MQLTLHTARAGVYLAYYGFTRFQVEPPMADFQSIDADMQWEGKLLRTHHLEPVTVSLQSCSPLTEDDAFEINHTNYLNTGGCNGIGSFDCYSLDE